MNDADDRREMAKILTGLGVDEADVPDSLADGAAMASDVVLARGEQPIRVHTLITDPTPPGIRTSMSAPSWNHKSPRS